MARSVLAIAAGVLLALTLYGLVTVIQPETVKKPGDEVTVETGVAAEPEEPTVMHADTKRKGEKELVTPQMEKEETVGEEAAGLVNNYYTPALILIVSMFVALIPYVALRSRVYG